ncbi:MAG: Crp/Fnr family transcriptional regulator [Burkholderiaceae bacterium]|nr:Crp/Fnr family transcriptional regulator [Burkholderiaceae bacterium]
MNLRDFSIFSPLTDAQLAAIAPLVRLRRLDKGDVACRKGDAPDGLYLLASGRLQVFEITEDGREVGLNLIQPGAFFGELSVIDDLPRSAHIVAMEPSVVGVLPQTEARRLFYQVPEMAEVMMKHLAGTVRSMSRHRVLLGIPNAFQRVFSLLIQMSRSMPGGLIVVQDVPRQQQIAIMLNTSRETVSRAITELIQSGVVEKDLRRLIVRKPDVLQQLASKVEAPQPPNGSKTAHSS